MAQRRSGNGNREVTLRDVLRTLDKLSGVLLESLDVQQKHAKKLDDHTRILSDVLDVQQTQGEAMAQLVGHVARQGETLVEVLERLDAQGELLRGVVERLDVQGERLDRFATEMIRGRTADAERVTGHEERIGRLEARVFGRPGGS